jgi:hypothetical protein
MAISKTKKGIFCIEGLWDYKNIEDRSTIMPILNLLETGGFCKYIFNNCATKTEFEYYLGRWKLKTTNKKYPILYLAFHGEQGCIFLKDNEKYSLEELAAFLGNKCMGKIIYFGSCSTLNIPKNRIDKFLENTGAIAAIGYKSQIGWIQSTACDLFVFEALQSDKLDTQGIKKMHKKIITDYGNLHKILELHVVINEKLHFKRTRKKVVLHE